MESSLSVFQSWKKFHTVRPIFGKIELTPNQGEISITFTSQFASRDLGVPLPNFSMRRKECVGALKRFLQQNGLSIHLSEDEMEDLARWMVFDQDDSLKDTPEYLALEEFLYFCIKEQRKHLAPE